TVRMFIIYHDYMHGSILKKSIIAKWLMNIFGMLILTPASIWKLSHDYHHKHNSKLYGASIGSYPIMTKKRFLASSRKERISYLVARHPLTILFGYFSMFMFGMVLNPFWNNPKKHLDAGFAFVFHISLLAVLSYFGRYDILFFTILIPFFLSMALGAYLFYAQHNFPGVKFKTNNNEWKHADAAMESTSFMKLNRFWNWITGNIGYHHIHHLNAHVPFYRLPEAFEKVDEFKNVVKTSLHPKDIVACLKLKLWDEENQKMIGLKDLKAA
ncbi:MAG: fatty acid desaturase, partial [Cytophagales bacterium]